MNDALDNITPPQGYDLIWIVMGVCFIILAILAIIVVFLQTRKVTPENDIRKLGRQVSGAERLDLVRSKYEEEVNRIEKLWTEKEISTRKAFQLLSISIRAFTHEYSESGAFAMTKDDLEKEKAPEILLTKVKHYYPIAFDQANRNADVVSACNDARHLIKIWH